MQQSDRFSYICIKKMSSSETNNWSCIFYLGFSKLNTWLNQCEGEIPTYTKCYSLSGLHISLNFRIPAYAFCLSAFFASCLGLFRVYS